MPRTSAHSLLTALEVVTVEAKSATGIIKEVYKHNFKKNRN
jgi:hypothetical protein